MDGDTVTNENLAAQVGSMPWWLVLIWGVCAVIIGLMLLLTPVVTAFYLILLMGFYWFVGGLFSFASLFSDRTNMGWKIAVSGLSLLAGLSIITYPLYSTFIILPVMVILIGFLAIIIGGVKLSESFRAKDPGSGVLGLLSVLFGIILFIFPYAAAYGLSIIAGFLSILAGFSLIFVSFQVKKGEGELRV